MTQPAFEMPLRNERTAPTFDVSKPRELPRFFADLEKLFKRAKIPAGAVPTAAEDAEMKDHATNYVDYTTEQVWKAIPEYKGLANTFDDFKKAILKHYPDASGDYIYSISNMDMLIGERQRVGINTNRDLSDYHLQFIAITNWLVTKDILGKLEQQRAYIRAFQPELLRAIMNRLQIKEADHPPNKPFEVEKVYEAAQFILQGTSPIGVYVPKAQVSLPPASIPSSSDGYIKQENFGAILAEFSKTIIDAINLNKRERVPAPYNNSDTGNRMKCNMCGGQHFIRECKVVDEYTSAGKCKRNQEGKVVLPNGSFVPRSIAGEFLRDRINEYHRRNPVTPLATTLLHTVNSHINTPITEEPTSESIIRAAYQLSKQERIATLESELYNLRVRKPAPTSSMQTRAQKAKAPAVENEDEAEAEPARAKGSSRVEEIEDEEPRGLQKEASTPAISSNQPRTFPEHPYKNARDAVYIPPTNRNIGVQVKPVINPRRNEAAYRALPPIHNPAIAVEVYKRSMDAPITITQRELLSLAPEIRSQVRDSTITRRVINKDSTTAQNLFQEEQEEEYNEQSDIIQSIPPTLTANTVNHRTLPYGSIVIEDPIETYYRSLEPGEIPDPDKLVVAMESGAVRSVYALVDVSQKKECILDPGCQIIAMSETTCFELGLPFDPTIILNMESANGNINQSLGLARNVPFQIGNITFYLQVHIIRSPAYDVLLGRPFDILTESIVRNFANEDQTITIRDPNSGRHVTVPTLPRTKNHQGACPHYKQKDF